MNSPQTCDDASWVAEIDRRIEEWQLKHSERYLGELENLPMWVENLAREIAKQNFPALRGKRGEFNAEILGLFLGQQCAKVYSWATYGEQLLDAQPNLTPERLAALEKMLKSIDLKNIDTTQIPILARQAIDIVQNPEQIAEFVEICHSAFRAALDQESYAQAVEFFVGFAEGLRNWQGVGGAYTDATPIYQTLYFNWRDVEKLGSVPELRAFLISRGLTEQQLGSDPKRLQKICERLCLKFRARGRPRKK